MAYIAPNFETSAVINSNTLFREYDSEIQKLMNDVGDYLETQENAIYNDLGTVVTDGIINDVSQNSFTTYSSNKIKALTDSIQSVNNSIIADRDFGISLI